VITEAGGHYGHVMTTTAEGPLPLPKRLEMRDLSVPDAPARVMPVDNYPRITAIAALPDNDGFVISGNQGQIDERSWQGAWQRQQLRAADAPNRWPGGGEDGLEFPGI